MHSDPHSARAGLLVLYASILLLALNGLFAKIIPLEATTITQVRSVVAGIALFLVLYFSRSALRLASFKQCVGVYGLGILMAVHWVTYFYSMQLASVAIGMLALFSYPVITVLIEPLFRKEWPKWMDVVAAVIVLVGVFLMVSDDIVKGDLASGAFVGAVWGVFSALIFSVRNTSQKYLFPHVNSISLMAHQALAISILLIPFVDFSGLVELAPKEWGYILLLGCLSTAMAHTFLSMSLKRLSAKTVGLISCSTPVFGALIAWLVLDEAPTTMVYVGGGVILSVAVWETLHGNSK